MQLWTRVRKNLGLRTLKCSRGDPAHLANTSQLPSPEDETESIEPILGEVTRPSTQTSKSMKYVLCTQERLGWFGWIG